MSIYENVKNPLNLKKRNSKNEVFNDFWDLYFKTT